MAEAVFVAPTRIEDAISALSRPGAVALAGGTSVGVLVGQGLLDPSALVWLGRIAELSGIVRDQDHLAIGAAVTLREVAGDATVRAELPALAAAAASIGNTRVRAVATVGGALAHADPRQDLPPVLMACGAEVEVSGTAGRRRLPVDQLATGFMSTVLEVDEVITAVRVPLVAGQRSSYFRYTPGSGDDYPTVVVAATAAFDAGRVTNVRVAVGGAGPTAFCVPEAATLTGAAPTAGRVANVAEAASRRAEPVGDRLGSAAYKRQMVAVWVRRALATCLVEPGAAA